MSKIKYEDVKDAASFHGWELISKEYVNLKTEMEFKCPQGHIVNSTWKKVRENFTCPICQQAQENYGAVEIKPKSKGVTRIIALDQATNVSGWSVYDNKELVAFGKIEFTQSDTFERMSRNQIKLVWKIFNYKVLLEKTDVKIQQSQPTKYWPNFKEFWQLLQVKKGLVQ